jgi:cytochrome P450 / NADPH-cytochrome P450 reductase
MSNVDDQADSEEENWGIAHRILMPAFGPLSLANLYDDMYDIASQLAMKWARYGSSTPILSTDDFTRLTLDTLALCAMDFRFNSYYRDQLHPFIDAMGEFLVESGNRSRRPPFSSLFYRETDRKYQANIDIMRRTADEVLQSRKANPSLGRKDLLQAMLDGVDSKTGKKMTDASIIDNLITFLIAGHETTSGMLSFAFYQLIKHPEAYLKVQKEVDEVCGTDPIKLEHLPKLQYTAAVSHSPIGRY